VLVVVVRMSVVAGTLTGPLGRLSAARLAVVPAAAGSCVCVCVCAFLRLFASAMRTLVGERRVVGAEVPEEGVPTRLRHCDFDPPQSGRVTGVPGSGGMADPAGRSVPVVAVDGHLRAPERVDRRRHAAFDGRLEERLPDLLERATVPQGPRTCSCSPC
jgi:hypothetical protein